MENTHQREEEDRITISPTLVAGNETTNLEDYNKEEGTGFYYKKEIEVINNKYNLIGVGCRYKVVLSVYSVGLYLNNIEKINNQNINDIINFKGNKLLLIKMYREVDILTMIGALNNAFDDRIPENIKEEDRKKIQKNLTYFTWILKKYINKGLKQHDELFFEWEEKNNKLNIYIGQNEKEISNSYFNEKIKDNLTPTNNIKKIGDIEDIDICRTLFNCYIDNNSVIPNIFYSINKFKKTLINN
jgi:hypothetical protein